MPDWIVVVCSLVAVACMIGWYLHRRSYFRARIAANIAGYPSHVPWATLTFWKPANYQAPTGDEVALVSEVCAAALLAWPDLADRLRASSYYVWLVRAPSQIVGWRSFDGIAWVDIPLINGIPAADPGDGYGGMCDRSARSIYVATFIPDRAPRSLLAHELTEMMCRSGHDSDAFRAREDALMAVLRGGGA